jgi:hypothetical protein
MTMPFGYVEIGHASVRFTAPLRFVSGRRVTSLQPADDVQLCPWLANLVAHCTLSARLSDNLAPSARLGASCYLGAFLCFLFVGCAHLVASTRVASSMSYTPCHELKGALGEPLLMPAQHCMASQTRLVSTHAMIIRSLMVVLLQA